MRRKLRQSRKRVGVALAATLFILTTVTLLPRPASAGILDFLFGGGSPLANPFSDPSATPAPAPQVVASGRYAVYCVRTCDGRYFPITMRGASAAQTCQAFCPASPTKVFSGSGIEHAVTTAGERYPDMANAFAYRKTLNPTCTCNGRDPGGLAPVDLSLDNTLRPGDVVATNDGLVAYTGVRAGNDRAAEFMPVNSYPGLSPDVRARLGEMKIAPISAHVSDSRDVANPNVTVRDIEMAPATSPPQTGSRNAKRAALD
ncbi:DUF2865 domain-containing protein [Afipia sp. TerB]